MYLAFGVKSDQATSKTKVKFITHFFMSFRKIIVFITFHHLYGLGDLQNYGLPKFFNKSESHISNTSLCMIIYQNNCSISDIYKVI